MRMALFAAIGDLRESARMLRDSTAGECADLIDGQIVIECKVIGWRIDLLRFRMGEASLDHESDRGNDLLRVSPDVAVQFELSAVGGECRSVGDGVALRTRIAGLPRKTWQRSRRRAEAQACSEDRQRADGPDARLP